MYTNEFSKQFSQYEPEPRRLLFLRKVFVRQSRLLIDAISHPHLNARRVEHVVTPGTAPHLYHNIVIYRTLYVDFAMEQLQFMHIT